MIELKRPCCVCGTAKWGVVCDACRERYEALMEEDAKREALENEEEHEEGNGE